MGYFLCVSAGAAIGFLLRGFFGDDKYDDEMSGIETTFYGCKPKIKK